MKKDRNLNGKHPVEALVFDTHQIHVLLLGETAISTRKGSIFQGCVVSQMGKRSRYTLDD